MTYRPALSIIVPTFNCRQALQACLASIARCHRIEVETIVVDQSSTDGTPQIARRLGAHVLTVPKSRFYSPPSEPRNIGARAATAPLLYHLDSDMQVTEPLLEEIISKLTHTFGALVIPERDLTGGFWSRCKAFERRMYWRSDTLESARAVRRCVFADIGGYDERLSAGEDFDVHERYKPVTTVGRCDHTVVHDISNLTFRRAVTKKFRYGYASIEYLRKHPGAAVQIASAEVTSYARQWALLRKEPMLALGLLAMRTAEGIAGLAGLSLALVASWRQRPHLLRRETT
jgi:glycosyltransferase involved in cell wall biosynthesis